MFTFGCGAKYKKQTQLTDKGLDTWVCVYNEHAAPAEIGKFDLAVVDGDAHPSLSELRRSKTILLGYVSLGEVGEYRWFWPEIAEQPWVLGKNPNWDSHMIDVRQSGWHDLVLKKIIPAIIAQGFHGLFLDTIDTAEYLERYHPDQKYPGAEKTMVTLIKEIRKQFPQLYLVANRGFAILDEIGSAIDGVVAESIFTTVDFAQNKMFLQTENQYRNTVAQLQEARDKFNITVFTLDYVDEALNSHIADIIARSRENGFIPFLSTPALDSVYTYTLEK